MELAHRVVSGDGKDQGVNEKVKAWRIPAVGPAPDLSKIVYGEPIKGYTPPHDGTYYAEHLDELADELNGTVLALVDPKASAEVTGDKVTVTIPADSFVVTRAAVLRYFDSQLVIFEESK